MDLRPRPKIQHTFGGSLEGVDPTQLCGAARAPRQPNGRHRVSRREQRKEVPASVRALKWRHFESARAVDRCPVPLDQGVNSSPRPSVNYSWPRPRSKVSLLGFLLARQPSVGAIFLKRDGGIGSRLDRGHNSFDLAKVTNEPLTIIDVGDAVLPYGTKTER